MTGRAEGRASGLARLASLARLKSEAEIARLATTAQSRGRLLAALAALGRGEEPLGPSAAGARAPEAEAEAPGEGTPAGTGAVSAVPPPLDPALVRARLAHRAWIEGQRRQINARLAMVEADWCRLQPVAARAFGRRRVLDDLAARAEDDARARKQAAAQPEG